MEYMNTLIMTDEHNGIISDKKTGEVLYIPDSWYNPIMELDNIERA